MNGGKTDAFSGPNFMIMKVVTALMVFGVTKEMINEVLWPKNER